ncbi:MAG: amidohydrolase family protein [Gemmatimonadota bacterium]
MAMKSVLVAGALGLAPALPADAQTYAIQGGTVHTLSGESFVGTVVIRDGRIDAVGPEVSPPLGAEIVDATGRHVYPGMFDAVTRLGLTEIGAVDVTNDAREQGDFNPHLRAATAVHPASEHIPVARANGVTVTMSAPQGGDGSIAGQASLIGLDGWTVEEMAIEPGAALVVNFPSQAAGGNTTWSDAQTRYEEAVQRLDTWMEAGRQHARALESGGSVPRDLKLEAMADVAHGSLPVLLAADGARNIRNAVEWAEAQGIRYVITGGREGWRIAEWLAERDVDMILSGAQAMPSGPDASYAEPYANAARLHAAGVRIAISTFDSSDSRLLPYEAAMSVPYGLPREAALAAVTRNAADMLGFGDRIGTLETGKLANVIVTDGDPLEIRTQILDVFILGRRVSTDNRHEELYERYRARPGRRLAS